MKTQADALARLRGAHWQGLLYLLEHDKQIIKATGVGLQVLVEIGEFRGGVVRHLVHPSGEAVEHVGKRCGICRIRNNGIRGEAVCNGGTSLRSTTLGCGFCCRSSSVRRRRTLLRRHLPLHKPSRTSKKEGGEEKSLKTSESAFSEVVG